jgi:F-type H+-transporting ATPase subunit a
MGNVIEAMCLYLRDEVVRPNLGSYTPRFLPYLWSLFFFVLSMNLLGLLPIADILGGMNPGHLLGGAPTANLWVTGALAVVTLCMMVYNGLRFHGPAYVKHFFMGPVYLAWFIAILEILGLFFKSMALAMRLFANMLGGHILLAVLLSLVQMAFSQSNAIGAGSTVAVIVGSAAIYLLKLFVCFLQAFIFMMLTTVFIGMSVNIHHDDHGEEHGHDEHAADPGHGHAAQPAASGH